VIAATSHACSTRNGVFACAAGDAATLELYKALQKRLKDLLPELAARGSVPPGLATLNADGRVGPATAVALQYLVVALAAAAPPPEELLVLLDPGASAEDVIAAAAAHADAALDYINFALLAYPDALARSTPPAPPPAGAAAQRPKITGRQVAAVGVGLAALGGMGFLLWGIGRKRGGRSDNAGFFDAEPDDYVGTYEEPDDDGDDGE
jgi:hypothetical protein